MFKTIFKWAFRLLILLIVLAVGLLLSKDVLIKSWFEYKLHKLTGLEVQIEKFEWRIFAGTVTAQGIKVYNSSEFGGSTFVDLPEVHMEYDRDALATRTLKYKLVRLNWAELNIVEGADGNTNLKALQAKLNVEKKNEEEKKARRKSEKLDFGGIDTLNLTLGHVKQMSLRDKDRKFDVDLGIKNEIVSGIKDEKDFQEKLTPIVLRSGAAALMQLMYQGGPNAVAPKPPPPAANAAKK